MSFVQGGEWASVLSEVKNHTGAYDPYVTIQVCDFFVPVQAFARES